MIFAFVPPAVRELGNASGFDVQLQDRGGLGHDALIAARNQLLGLARRTSAWSRCAPTAWTTSPQFQLDIDDDKAGALGVSVADINDTLSTAWGGTYVNDFIDRGRVKRVYLQGEAPTRA